MYIKDRHLNTKVQIGIYRLEINRCDKSNYKVSNKTKILILRTYACGIRNTISASIKHWTNIEVYV